MNKEIQPENLPSECVELIDRILPQLPIKAEDGPAFALVLHLKYLVALSRDAIFLESEGRNRSTPVIARAVLEALFKVTLALKAPEIAATQTLLELEWDRIQTDSPGSNPKDIEAIRAKPEYTEIGRAVAKVASRWGLPAGSYLKAKRYTTWNWADKGGMADTYKYRYAQLSNYAHATAGSYLAARQSTYVLNTISFALLDASLRLTEHYKDTISAECRTLAKTLWQTRRDQTMENFIRCAGDLPGHAHPAPPSPDEKSGMN